MTVQSSEQHAGKGRVRATNEHPVNSIGKALDDYQRVARTVVYALTLGTTEAWIGLSFVMSVRLEIAEREAFANAVFESLAGSSSMPIAPLFRFIDEAAFWADLAEPRELEAYCLACFKAMSANRRADFLKFARREFA